jgi:hypothetical protein
MTLYRFPSGKITSDEDYKKTFSEEFPADRPEADPDFIPATSNRDVQVCFSDEDGEDDD